MGVISLPENLEQDRIDGIKANSKHVQDNFDALLMAVNNKLDIDGTIVPTADLNMGSHKISAVATPTVSADAATKGYVDSADLLKANVASPTFTGTPKAPTPSTTDNSTTVATTAHVINVLKLMYPVGAIYIGTQNSCPMASLFGTWSLVSSGRALWTGNGSNGNSTIAAGLPNITGAIADVQYLSTSASGALYVASSYAGSTGTGHSGGGGMTIGLNAQNSNSIYGNSTTVQPPAYVVNVWRRTA